MESVTSNNQSQLTKIHILPCLQELKQARLFEPEQQEGIFDIKTNQMEYRYGKLYDTSDQYDKKWTSKTENLDESIYNIPSFRKYGFTKECNRYSMLKKWIMYFNYFSDELNKTGTDLNNIENIENSVIIVTHHNRLRSSNINQGIFPMNKNFCNAYANAFCVKLTNYNTNKDDLTLNCKIVDSGYPDKGEFNSECAKKK